MVPNFFFSFWIKLYSFTNSNALIKNLIIVFLKLQPKIPKSGIFGPKFKHFLFLDETLHVNKFEDAGFKFDFRFLKFQPKYQIKTILGPNLRIFFMAEICFKKCEGADVKKPHYSSFFEFQP